MSQMDPRKRFITEHHLVLNVITGPDEVAGSESIDIPE